MTTKTEARGWIRTGRGAVSVLCLLTVAGLLSGAENPFVGTWKLNPALSQTVLTFERAPSGMIRYSIGGSNLRYTFAIDGAQKTPDPLGDGSVLGKQVDNSTWQLTKYTAQGGVLWTETWKLASDGQTIANTETGADPNSQVTAVLERVTGTSGLFGTWKWKLSGISYPGQFEIQPFGDDGLALIAVEYGATCKAKFDGKEYACTGPADSTGMTMALKQTGPRAFEATSNQNRKLLFIDKYVVSPDGRHLANMSKPAGLEAPLAWVYDRQ